MDGALIVVVVWTEARRRVPLFFSSFSATSNDFFVEQTRGAVATIYSTTQTSASARRHRQARREGGCRHTSSAANKARLHRALSCRRGLCVGPTDTSSSQPRTKHGDRRGEYRDASCPG